MLRPAAEREGFLTETSEARSGGDSKRRWKIRNVFLVPGGAVVCSEEALRLLLAGSIVHAGGRGTKVTMLLDGMAL